eukprot:15439892-Alexandrium_andersonii.AAC.1
MWSRTSAGRDWRTKVAGFWRKVAHSACGTTSSHSVQRKVTSLAEAASRVEPRPSAPPPSATPPLPASPTVAGAAGGRAGGPVISRSGSAGK